MMRNVLEQMFLKNIDQTHDENLISLVKEGYLLENECTFLKNLMKYSHSGLINFLIKLAMNVSLTNFIYLILSEKRIQSFQI